MALTAADWPGWPRGAPHPAAAWDRLGQERKALKESPGAALEEALKPRVVCSGPSSPCTYKASSFVASKLAAWLALLVIAEPRTSEHRSRHTRTHQTHTRRREGIGYFDARRRSYLIGPSKGATPNTQRPPTHVGDARRTTSSQRHDAAATWTAAFSSASAVPGPKGICPTIGPSAFRRIGSVVVLDDAFGQTVPNAELPCPILVL
ncbi:hypothetical protein THAR02_10381 [Trichoderma harzianum]|uniref:Uncharacterized protein n=1 Tax=Trichoderma harzianum TaxID=5544 RepID=A0A0F9ZWH9_TRIHA|nr:hypothetical protein THAR02_10381 [Trichoderma harzianum]